MSIRKEYPILEFDEERIAKINPALLRGKYPTLPERLIITFFKEVINKLLDENRIQEHLVIKGENNLVIYKYCDDDILIIHGTIGAPACAGYYDEMIALGVNKTIFCGGAGVLKKDLTVGKLILVDSAIRDEGFSYHYLSPSRYVMADSVVLEQMRHYFNQKGIEFIQGRTWTTDAFYRETPTKIELRKEEGALIVEMEQAAMLAVSHFRNVKYGAIIYCGDDLSGEVWDSRHWNSRQDIRYRLNEICLEIIKMI